MAKTTTQNNLDITRQTLDTLWEQIQGMTTIRKNKLSKMSRKRLKEAETELIQTYRVVLDNIKRGGV